MTKGVKIGIAIGVLAVVGVAVYFFTRKKPSDDDVLMDVSDDEVGPFLQ